MFLYPLIARAEFQQDIERQEVQMFREEQEEKEEKEHSLLMEWNDAENRRLQALR